MQVRLLALLVAVGAVVALDGCGDPTAIRAQYTNIDAKPSLYAFNGTPTSVASALIVQSASAVRLDAGFSFDIAFDLNAANEVVVYTVRALASQLAPTRRVGLQQSDRPFAEVTQAPTSGYAYDSSMVLPVGRTLFIDAIGSNCSAYSLLGQNVRAKLVIDSLDVATRHIFLHMLSNPNCGFKSLEPGEPKN